MGPSFAPQTVSVAGSKASYWREGTPGRPTLLLVHGLGASKHIWQAVAARLSPDFELLAVDLPTGGPAGPASYAGFLAAFLDALGVRQVAAALGHSLGGATVLELGLRDPARVASLLVCNGAPMMPHLARWALRLPHAEKLLALPAGVPRRGSRLATRAYLAAQFGQWRAVTSEVVEGYARLGDEPGYFEAMAAAMVGFARHTRPLEDLRHLHAPVSLVFGDRDPLFRPSVGEAMAQVLPRAALHRLPQVGHCPPQEAPDAVASLTRALLQSSR
jgi:pimeloyl-ACP methyl ester carboxylesterase